MADTNQASQLEFEPDDLNVMSQAHPDEVADLDEALLEAPESQQPGAAKPQPKDKQGTDSDPDDDSDDDDERQAKVDQELRDAPDEATRQQIRDRNKQQRLNQRQRHKQRIDNLERQLANAQSLIQDQAQRLAQVEGGQRGVQYQGLQSREQEALQAEQQLKAVIADATSKGDGNTVAEATARLFEVQQYRTSLAGAREQFEREQQQPRRQTLHPQVMDHARAFMAKNQWYKGPRSQDQDSQVLATIDRTLVAEGWNPASPAYWQELEARAARYLPHRFGESEAGDGGGDRPYNQAARPAQRQNGRRAPVMDGGNQPGGGKSTPPTMRLSADRVRAMKEAGMWDDPDKRAKMIARYRAQDQAAGQN